MTGAQPAAPAPLIGAGRFAPTPTGRLHLGNARTALLAWLTARAAGLRTILRVEDLDPRAIPDGCLEEQYADLDWLGLRHDEDPRWGGPVGPYRQSERFDRYAHALQRLNEQGLIYPCWCSRREVHDAARAPHASDEGPVYAGTCRPVEPGELTLDAVPKRNGRVAALRIDVARAMRRLGWSDVRFDDAVAGRQVFDMIGGMGDFVVRRKDGVGAYQVACAHDDAAMGCTLVLRGADLLASTARQILLLSLWQAALPTYAHVGLVTTPAGERLAKRDASIALAQLRADGVAPGAVVRQLARLSGLPDTADLDLLTAAVDLRALSAAPVALDAR